MKVKPCPKKCQFDWEDFHQKFDMALAHLISEGTGPGEFPVLPSRTSLMTMLEYSTKKAQLQIEKKISRLSKKTKN